MKLRVGDDVYSGRAIDLSSVAVTPDAVLRAIGGEPSDLLISCRQPHAIHEHVGHIHPAISLSRRSALAATARSNGYTAPQDVALAEIREQLASIDPPAISVRAARKRVAETGAECERLHEAVAAQRGRVQALRDLGEDASAAETQLRDTVGALSEQETERIAAAQTLAHAEKQARDARDRRERRLRLEDRAANLRRAARRSLAPQVRDEVVQAETNLPVSAPEPVAFALALARVGTVRAPVVLSGSWFETEAGADWLNTPVIRL